MFSKCKKVLINCRNCKHQHLLKKSLMENFSFYAVNLSKPFVFTKGVPHFYLAFVLLKLVYCWLKMFNANRQAMLKTLMVICWLKSRYTDKQPKIKMREIPSKLFPFLYKNWSAFFELNMDDTHTEELLVLFLLFPISLQSVCC